MSTALSSLLSVIFPSQPGQCENNPLELTAVPGLTTLLDLALFRSNEGQLTATICSSHALLRCWLDVKLQSQLVLQSLVDDEDAPIKVLCESFSRQALESSMDATERLSTDKLAQAANLSDPYESTSGTSAGGGHHQLLSGVGAQGVAAGILESMDETGRRMPSLQRRRDCWESPRLHCPDFCWADDSYLACQRWIRNLIKHPFVLRENDTLVPLAGTTTKDNTATSRSLSASTERQVALLIQLIQDDLPMRLYHFKQAIEAEAVVTKRLYLVKCEYRAPFRAFLEAHQSLLRAPPMQLVESRLQSSSKGIAVEDYKAELQSLLKTPELVDLLALERECEQMELDMGQALFPFTEFARSLDHKKARLKVVPGVVDEIELPELQETVRRLKCVLCRKGGSETSTGIRPILLDLQGVTRDDEVTKSSFSASRSLEERVDRFLSQLECISTLIKTKNAFLTQKQGHHDIDFSFSVVKGCSEDQFDPELLKCQLLDWYELVEKQHSLLPRIGTLPDQIRQAEMAMSIAGASEQSMGLVKERLEKMRSDRRQRLEVLKEMVEELCLREMHLYVKVSGPDPNTSLVLKETSALGFLGLPLQIAREPLPIG